MTCLSYGLLFRPDCYDFINSIQNNISVESRRQPYKPELIKSSQRRCKIQAEESTATISGDIFDGKSDIQGRSLSRGTFVKKIHYKQVTTQTR